MSTQLTHRRYTIATIAMVVMVAVMAFALAACKSDNEAAPAGEAKKIAAARQDGPLHIIDKLDEKLFVPSPDVTLDDMVPEGHELWYRSAPKPESDNAIITAIFGLRCYQETPDSVVGLVSLTGFGYNQSPTSVRYTVSVDGHSLTTSDEEFSRETVKEISQSITIPAGKVIDVQLYTNTGGVEWTGPVKQMGPITC